jgi:cytochrome c biogenesis protein CcdA
MKWKAITVVVIIIVSLLPVYLVSKSLQKAIQPKKSFGRLLLYLLAGFALIFGYTFLLVLFIKKLFPGV